MHRFRPLAFSAQVQLRGPRLTHSLNMESANPQEERHGDPQLSAALPFSSFDYGSWDVRQRRQPEQESLSMLRPSKPGATIDAFYLSRDCELCGTLSRDSICEACASDQQRLAFIVQARLSEGERIAQVSDDFIPRFPSSFNSPCLADHSRNLSRLHWLLLG